MTGYLVFGNCSIDDVPLYFAESHKDAERFAREATPEDVVRISKIILKRDLSAGGVIGIGIIKFTGGLPVKCEPVFMSFS